MKLLSIVIPTYNEAETLPQVIKEVMTAPAFNLKKEIIIIDDGSTDDTSRVVKLLQKTYTQKLIFIFHNQNIGKGAAVKDGLLKSTGDVVLIQDADLEYTPRDYERLIGPIVQDKADIVYGSRFQGAGEHRVLYFWHTVVNNCLTLLSNIFTNLNLTDMECGFKAFRGSTVRNLAPALRAQRFGFEPEITALCAKNKHNRFFEVGISYFGRTYSEGKHIRWYDGLKAVIEIIRFNVFSSQ